jgi:D-sedoheptulose 7-phosphate isomerase
VTPAAHVDALRRALDALDLRLVERWGTRLAWALLRGQRLLVAGNGGSAAHAQHLTAELVGRYRAERTPFSAIALHTETSTVTAIGNDYGFEEVFARQVRAHGRPGDILLAISTSGRSSNLITAARTARAQRLGVWALTGPAPNPLASAADDVVAVAAGAAATVQEVHQVVVHLVCDVVDRHALAVTTPARTAAPAVPG